jgi:hypothetical protein
MMTYPEYLSAKEYRARLKSMLDFGHTKYVGVDWDNFRLPLESEIDTLDRRIREFLQTSTASVCSFVGLTIRTELPPTESNVCWNTPLQTSPAYSLPQEKQMSLLDDSPILLPNHCIA